MSTLFEGLKVVKYQKSGQQRNNWIDVKEIQRLVNIAKGDINTDEFLNVLNLPDEEGKETIIDMIKGKYNPYVRVHHLRKIAKASHGRITFEKLNEIYKFEVDNTPQDLKEIKVKRGDIYYVNLGKFFDSVQGGIKPAIVIQNDKGNFHSTTIQVIPITTAKKNYQPTHVEINDESILPKYSVAMLEQTRVTSKSQLFIDSEISRIGCISDSLMVSIEAALKVAYGLISGNFNPKFAEDLVRAYLSIIEIKNENNQGLFIAKNQIWTDLKNYCNDYNKDVNTILCEFSRKIARSENNFKNMSSVI